MSTTPPHHEDVPSVNCSEASALVGTMIDGLPSDIVRTSFQEHLNGCPICRRSYELELIAKSLVRSRLSRQTTPIDVRRAILSSIRTASDPLPALFTPGFFRTRPLAVYGLAAAILLVLSLFLTSTPDPVQNAAIAHAGLSDLMVRTASTFDRFRTGALKPSIVTCSPESMYGFFHSRRLPFEVLVTPMERCDGYGAMVDEFEGIRLAHVTYTIGDELLYVCQVLKDDALTEGGRLTIPVAGREAVMKTGWYTDPDHADCNVVVWEESGTLCAATSTMDKSKMIALLATR